MRLFKALYSHITKLPLILVILIAGTSLIGWIIGKVIIASVSMKFIPMAPSTGFFFLILGISLFNAKNRSDQRFYKVIILSLLTFTLLFCITVIVEFIFKLQIDIENIFISNPANFDKVPIGRMSPITALLFGTSCLGIWGKINSSSRIIQYVGGSSATLTTFIASVLTIGYLFNAPLLYGQNIIPVALLTAICFLLLGISLIQSYDLKYWTFNLFQNNQIQLKLLSTFLPLVIFVIILQGFIETNFFNNQNNPTLTTAIIILIIVGITIFIVSKASSYLGQKLTEAENALKEKTLFLDKVIESSAVSTWISDENGTAIRTNPACLTLFGAEKEEIIGKYNIFKDNVIEVNGFLPVIKDVFEKGKYANIIIDYDFASVDHVNVKNATHKTVNSIFTPVTDVNGKVTNVIVQAIDLTEIKTIQEAAIEERNKAQQYLDIAGVMLVSLDNNGIVQLINPKGCEILGYRKHEILGKNWYENFLPESEKSKVKVVAEKVLNGKIEEVSYFENKIKTKLGEERLIAWRNALITDEFGNIQATLSSGEDITDRKKDEIELIKAKEKTEESENFLTNIINSIGDPVFVKDDQRRFVIVNEAFCSTLRLQQTEIIGKTLIEDVPAEEQEVFSRTDRQVLQDGIENINQEQLTFRGGDTITISTRKNRYIDEKGNKFIIGVIRDVSLRIQQEEELLKAKQRAEESDRLKTAFLQNMSHEIRTPMNSIMGFANLLEDEDDKATITNYSNIIYKNSEQLVHIIDDIVLYSQLQNRNISINLAPININEMFVDIKKSFDLPEYKKGIELQIENSLSEAVKFNSDYDKLRQIFVNLISNAFKYTIKGSITFGITTTDGKMNFFVKDTGMGIPKTEIDKIFDRFYRASNVNKGSIAGTGLGLSIVKELVELLGGKIGVESELGMGTTFCFTIPVQAF